MTKLDKRRNKTATSPLMKKGGAHKSSKDYNRKKAKPKLTDYR